MLLKAHFSRSSFPFLRVAFVPALKAQNAGTMVTRRNVFLILPNKLKFLCASATVLRMRTSGALRRFAPLGLQIESHGENTSYLSFGLGLLSFGSVGIQGTRTSRKSLRSNPSFSSLSPYLYFGDAPSTKTYCCLVESSLW
jgi:hypothetical protein